MPDIAPDAGDAAELAELLQFISDWLAADPATLSTPPGRIIGHPANGTDELRHDLDRFTFLLGGNDGEPLFQPRPRY